MFKFGKRGRSRLDNRWADRTVSLVCKMIVEATEERVMTRREMRLAAGHLQEEHPELAAKMISLSRMFDRMDRA